MGTSVYGRSVRAPCFEPVASEGLLILAEDDPTRIDPGEFYRKNWEIKYREQRKYTSDKRYHYLGSGKCYYLMGESMAKSMVELPK